MVSNPKVSKRFMNTEVFETYFEETTKAVKEPE